MLEVLAVIVVVGLFLWAINALIPMQAQYKNALNVLAIFFLCVWLITLFLPGLTASIMAFKIGSVPAVHVLGVIVIVGLALWVVDAIVPMKAQFKKALYVVAVLFLCLWLITLFVPNLTSHLGH